MGILMSVAFISCTSKNNNADQNAVIATDSSMMAKDNTQQTVTSEASPSSAMSSAATADSTAVANKVAMAKPDLSKKGKKGKVTSKKKYLLIMRNYLHTMFLFSIFFLHQ